MAYTRERTESIHYLRRPRTAETPRSSRAPPRPRAGTNATNLVGDEPWKHMAQTYTWVLQQEEEKLKSQNKKTERWVVAQQNLLAQRPKEHSAKQIGREIETPRAKTWDELVTGYDADVHTQMARDAEHKRAALEREREREKGLAVNEEIRRVQAREQRKKEQEKGLLATQRMRLAEREREMEGERERQESARANVTSAEAWRAYESRWAKMSEASGPMTFRTVAWPLVSRPSNIAGIVPASIIAFLLSPLHSPTQSRKDRIRAALLRWHPDRFQKFLARVVEKDREAVSEGVGIIARCLNELMERETRAIRRECDSHRSDLGVC
ncbi:hypothetical protein HWV62_16040 [Athelia sp. TMB]|nr:hypothetical protein HWV62_19765 [Athelia sp. TMB]KAF7984230.1 hypothetical protein HWV62_16040 [Athelia sp. TMB]